MSDFEREVKFLIDRLRQFENENMDEESFRDWNGHVAPSIARLETMMESQGGELERDVFEACAQVLDKEAEAVIKTQGLGRKMTAIRLSTIAQRLRTQADGLEKTND